MTAIDTSTEAVERLAQGLDETFPIIEGYAGPYVDEQSLREDHDAASAVLLALLKERDEARARVRALEEITDPDFIWGAMDNVRDMDVTLDDYAKAVSRAQRAALAAIEPAPVTPAEARAHVQALVDAGERMTGPLWRLILADENCIENPCDLPTCECRQKFYRIAGPLFAALAALKEAHK